MTRPPVAGETDFSRALDEDWQRSRADISRTLKGAKVLVIGGAGTIGSACVNALIEFAPRRIDVLDVDENGLARLTRDIRGRFLRGLDTELNFQTLDFGSWPAMAYLGDTGPFDLVLNFAAIKHVRSEKNLFTLLHMIDTNVVKQRRVLEFIAERRLARRYFAVSTDKAADPANFMGATKKLLEEVVLGGAEETPSRNMARFANVAFSSGSLLESFVQRLSAGQPLAVPADTRRYFITERMAAQICLLTVCLAPDRRIVVPRLRPDAHAEQLTDTVTRFLAASDLAPTFVTSIDELAGIDCAAARAAGRYPVLLTPRDTAGEKEIEAFWGTGEAVSDIGLSALEGVIPARSDRAAVSATLDELARIVGGEATLPGVDDLYRLISAAVPSFHHAGGGANLDGRL